jgi:hypothetical protein
MRVESTGLGQALANLQPGGEPVQQAVSIAVIKETLQLSEEAMRQLLQSVQPHLGRHVDLRA